MIFDNSFFLHSLKKTAQVFLLLSCSVASMAVLSADTTTGLEAHWEFDNNFSDSSGNNYTLSNSGLGFGTDRNSNASSATVGSTSSYAYYNSSSIFNNIQTVAYWIKRPNPFSGIFIGAGSGSNADRWEQYADSSTGEIRNLYLKNSSSQYSFFNFGTNDSDWHHVVTTFGVGGANYYFDGVLVATKPTTQIPDSGFSKFYINTSTHDNDIGANGSNAQLDDVRLYSRRLSAEDILALFQGTSVPEITPAVVSIGQEVMRLDGPEGHVLSVESSNLSGKFPPSTRINASINWQFPDDENTSAVYKGEVFGNWAPNSSLSTIHNGITPTLGSTQSESFSFITPAEPGIYSARMILNASFSAPSSFSDFTHYKYDFVFEVSENTSGSANYENYINRNEGTEGHFVNFSSDTISGTTVTPGETVNGSFSWSVPEEENFSAVFKGNLFGSWNQSSQISTFHDGITPSQGSTQSESFSFTAPTTPGRYAVRIVLNASFNFASGFQQPTHYYKDLVFVVAEVSEETSESLIGQYFFNGNVSDESGNGNAGTVKGATLTTDRHGNANSAYSFDGVNDSIELPITSESLGSEFTLSAWVYVTKSFSGNGKMGVISSDKYSGARGVFMGLYSGDRTGVATYQPGGSGITGPTITKDAWKMMTVTYESGGLMKFYLDGGLIDTVSATSAVVGGNLNIGWDSYSTSSMRFFGGKIDDVYVYEAALSASEVTELYDDVVTNTDNPPVAEAGPSQSLNADSALGATVTLSGSSSSDDKDISSYAWSGSDGSSYSGISPEINAPVGVTTYTLTVTDTTGQTDTDTVEITVSQVEPALAANAGQDQIVDDDDATPGVTVTLDASGSTGGGITAYAWIGPGGASYTGISPQVIAPVGTTRYTLAIVNSSGQFGTDTVTITVNPYVIPSDSGDTDTDTDTGDTFDPYNGPREGVPYFSTELAVFDVSTSILHIPSVEYSGSNFWLDLRLEANGRYSVLGYDLASTDRAITPATFSDEAGVLVIPYVANFVNATLEAERYQLQLNDFNGQDLAKLSTFQHDFELTYLHSNESYDSGLLIRDSNSDEMLIVFGEKNVDGSLNSLGGVTYVDADGNLMTTFVNEEGLPAYSVIGDLVFSYSNYTLSTVDIEIIDAEGVSHYVRDIPLSEAMLSALKRLSLSTPAQFLSYSALSSSAGSGGTYTQYYELLSRNQLLAGASLIANTAGCAAAIAATGPAAATVVGVSATLWLAGVNCLGMFRSLYTLVYDTDDDVVDATTGVSCVLGDLGACAVVGLDRHILRSFEVDEAVVEAAVNGQPDAEDDGTQGTETGGFGGSFKKVSASGQILDDNAQSWTCILDESTNLLWEVKAASGDRSVDQEYREANNAGSGYYSYSEGRAYLSMLNEEDTNGGLCGSSGWRFPGISEFETLIENQGGTINRDLFKYIALDKPYWTYNKSTEQFVGTLQYLFNLSDGSSEDCVYISQRNAYGACGPNTGGYPVLGVSSQ